MNGGVGLRLSERDGDRLLRFFRGVQQDAVTERAAVLDMVTMNDLKKATREMIKGAGCAAALPACKSYDYQQLICRPA